VLSLFGDGAGGYEKKGRRKTSLSRIATETMGEKRRRVKRRVFIARFRDSFEGQY